MGSVRRATVAVNGVELAVATHGTGDGVPFVLVHGFTGNADDWAGVVDDLSEQRVVVTVEHRGHGDSTNTGDAATYTFDQLAADLSATLDELDLGPIDLLGHSMGGMVAQRLLLGGYEGVRSLILMDTGARPNPDPAAGSFMRAGLDRAREHGMLAVYEAMERFLPEGDRARVRRSLERMDPVAFCTLGEELLTYSSMLDAVATLRLPTTVLVGVDDHGLRGASDDLAAAIPGATLVVIPDAAHSPQLENRTAWLAAVETHLTTANRV